MTQQHAKRNEKEISMDRVHQIFTELGSAEPTGTTYFPHFNDGVLVLGPDNSMANVSENYCLRIPSALELMCILADLNPVGYLDPPQQFATGSTMYYSEQVPWLRFANGAVRNAGQLAVYWKGNNGDPNGQIAEDMARQDLAWG